MRSPARGWAASSTSRTAARRNPSSGRLDRTAMPTLPIIDVASLIDPRSSPVARAAVARELDVAARRHGFFYAVHHGVDAALIERLVALCRTFFAQPEATKLQIPMSAGGRAWRGYFS